MTQRDILHQIFRPGGPETYRQVRRLWQAHQSAHSRHDLPGLLATLTDDCVYELANDGRAWRGHAGAAEFYSLLFQAFPDACFDVRHIVIGPQGVYEEAHAVSTHQADWLEYLACGRQIEFDLVLFFPWDPQSGKFTGQRILFFNLEERAEAADLAVHPQLQGRRP